MRRRRRSLRRTVIAAALVAAASPSGLAAAATGTPQATWVPDGPVYDVALRGSTAYLGGSFDTIAPFTGGSLALAAGSDVPRGEWPDVGGTVVAAVADGHGGWYLGGNFSAVGGAPRNGLAHVRADGTVDPAWAPSANSTVYALAVHGDKVYAGGSFDRVNDITHPGIVELDAATGGATALPLSVDGQVGALAVDAARGHLYVGGYFNTAGGAVRRSAAAFDLATGATTAFDPDLRDGVVSDIEPAGDRVYLAGGFRKVNGSKPFAALAAVSATTGALDASWSPQLNDYALVQDVDLQGDTVYFGGRFTQVNTSYPSTADRKNLAALDAVTAAPTAWAPEANADVQALEISGGTVFVGGTFTDVGGVERAHAAAVKVGGTGDVLPWDPRPRGAVLEIGATGAGVLLGGLFRSAGGVARDNLAAIDLRTGLPTAFRADADAQVDALALGPQGLWVGGRFDAIAGSPRGGLAVVDPDSGGVGPFAQGVNGPVDALAVSGSTVYAGGEFTKVGTTTRRHAAAFDAPVGSPGTLLAFDPDPDGTVEGLAVGHGRVYLAGDVRTLRNGAVGRRGLAAVDPVTGVPTAWDARLNHGAQDVLVDGATVLVAGDFDAAGAVARNSLAALDADTAAPTPLNPGAATDGVQAVAAAGGRVFATGDWNSPDPWTTVWLRVFEGPGGSVSDPWPGGQDGWGDSGRVRTLDAGGDGWLIAGGDFGHDRGPVRSAGFAAYRLPAPYGGDATPGGGTGAGGAGTGGTGAGGGAQGQGGGAGKTASDRTKPKVSRLTASRARFRVGALPRRGTRLTIVLSEAASVKVEALARTCTKAKRRGGRKRCALVAKGTATRRLTAGTSTVAFTGRFGSRALKPGAYVLRVTPTDAAGNRGAARTVTVRVLR